MKYVKYITILVLVCTITTGCSKSRIEKRKITKNAITYFTEKYSIKEKNIDIKNNGFYGQSAFCWNTCGENELDIIYNEKEYTIKYDLYNDSFGDNYQYEQIYNDLYKYLENKFPFATKIKIDLLEEDVLYTSTKYNHDIINYMKNVISKDYFEDGYTWIDIWVETKNEMQAKEMHEKYSNIIISELENIKVSYNVAFSSEENYGETNAFYYYHVYENNFIFKDNVDKNRKSCNRSTLVNEMC